MHSSAIMFPLFTALLLLTVGISMATPIVLQNEQMVGRAISSPAMQLAKRNDGKMEATCYDHKLTKIFNAGLAFYTQMQNMGRTAEYILNQIEKAGIKGSWLVHAQIKGQHPVVEWWSITNGDLFKEVSTHGCFYADKGIYIVAVRYA